MERLGILGSLQCSLWVARQQVIILHIAGLYFSSHLGIDIEIQISISERSSGGAINYPQCILGEKNKAGRPEALKHCIALG